MFDMCKSSVYSYVVRVEYRTYSFLYIVQVMVNLHYPPLMSQYIKGYDRNKELHEYSYDWTFGLKNVD